MERSGLRSIGGYAESVMIPGPISVVLNPNYARDCNESFAGKQAPPLVQCSHVFVPHALVKVDLNGTIGCYSATPNVTRIDIVGTNGEYHRPPPLVRGGNVPPADLNLSFADQANGDGVVSVKLNSVHCNWTPNPGQEYPMIFPTGVMVVTQPH